MGQDARPRRPMTYVPLPGEAGRWLALEDDDVLQEILSLPPDHAHDHDLVEVVRSERHLFVRQEAAKRIRNGELLRELASERHVGEILSRRLQRESDLAYLEQLAHVSRHAAVRQAAEARILLRGAVSRR